MELFNNKENDILKFKLNSEGIDINNIETRLVLTTKENKNFLLIGEVDNGICKFNIPQLTLFEKGSHGKIKFEIISEDLYFPVWQDEFEIKSKASITINEMVSEIQHQNSNKPKISVTESPKIETKSQIKVEPKKIESVVESIFDTFESKQKEIKQQIEETEETIEQIEKIKRFDNF